MILRCRFRRLPLEPELAARLAIARQLKRGKGPPPGEPIGPAEYERAFRRGGLDTRLTVPGPVLSARCRRARVGLVAAIRAAGRPMYRAELYYQTGVSCPSPKSAELDAILDSLVSDGLLITVAVQRLHYHCYGPPTAVSDTAYALAGGGDS